MLVVITIVHRFVAAPVAHVLSSWLPDASMLVAQEVSCPVELAVSVERASLTFIRLGLLLHTFQYDPTLFKQLQRSSTKLKQ